jgi:putative MATE family efflux protein
MILIMFFQFAIGLTDVYVAGYLGTNVLAAVGYVGQLYFTLIIIGNGLTVGTVSMASQAYGARALDVVGSITGHSLIIGVAVSSSLSLLAGLYPGYIVRMAGMPAEIEGIATAFMRVFSLVLVPTYVMIITAGVLRASGRIRFAMVNSFIAAAVNVVGDFVLPFGWGPVPALGYVGIAWASALATSLGMVLNLFLLCYGPSRTSFQVLWSPLSRCFKNLVKLGIPSALQQTAWNAGTLVVYFLVGRIEEGQITALAAMTAGLRIEAMIFLPIFAFNMAAAVLTGNRVGTGDLAGARSGAKAAALLCLLFVSLPALAIFVFAPHICTFLTDDPAVLAEMTRYLRVNMVAVPFMAVGISLSGALQGAGDTLGTMKIIFVGMWLIRLPLIIAAIYLLKTGAVGVWCAMTLSIAFMCALFGHRFRGTAWTTASIDDTDKTMLWEACIWRSRLPD